MKILLYKDVILDYIRPNLEDNEHKNQIRQIRDNKESVFLYSDNFFKYIKESLGDEFINEYEIFFTKISDSGQSVKSSPDSKSFDDEFLHLFSVSPDNVVVSLAYRQPSKQIQSLIPNIAVFVKQKKPNYHWMVVNLIVLQPNKVTVDNFDFKTDDEIKAYFDSIFSIPKQISTIRIFDRYMNVDKHSLFDNFKGTTLVECYTLKDRREKTSLDVIKKYFNKPKIFVTKNKGITHPRRILFENFILKSDNDFPNLTTKDAWDVDIQYSERLAEKLLQTIVVYYKEI